MIGQAFGLVRIFLFFPADGQGRQRLRNLPRVQVDDGRLAGSSEIGCACWPLRKGRWAIASRVVQENARHTASKPKAPEETETCSGQACVVAQCAPVFGKRPGWLPWPILAAYQGCRVDPGSCRRLGLSLGRFCKEARKCLPWNGCVRAGRCVRREEKPLDNHLQVEEPICIAATGDVCGEGVLWERETQSIYWTDINRFLLHRYSLQNGTLKTWFFSEPVTCVMETSRKDTLALSLGSGIALWEPGSDAPHTPLFALPGWPFVRCNDAAVDPGGALWVGSMRNNVLRERRPVRDRRYGRSALSGRRDGRRNGIAPRPGFLEYAAMEPRQVQVLLWRLAEELHLVL